MPHAFVGMPVWPRPGGMPTKTWGMAHAGTIRKAAGGAVQRHGPSLQE